MAGKYAKAQGLENTFAMLLFFFVFKAGSVAKQ